MRIKQLEIIGLKSFANRTILDFPAGITGIVGPNGCGKSNVVDAIRWVLGEQSPKHLRGDSMEDVIFKGNDRVAPSGMAQVSLTFENAGPAPATPDPDLDVSTLPAHFRNLSEIKISRRYFRSGESEYLINNTPCRLKDITELFLGTGVGSKAYAIIEQGRVEQLINAKPEDRRLLIEEAGGTTLFRSRRLAAERKIERTRENLLRVSDVLRELERQIQYLHRLAKKAEQYRTLQQEARHLDLALYRLQKTHLTEQVNDLDVQASQLRETQAELLDRLNRLEEARGEDEKVHASVEQEFTRQQQALASLEGECRTLAQRIEFVRQEMDERHRRLAKLQAESAQHVIQLQRLDQAIAGDVELRAQCEADLKCDEEEAAKGDVRLEDARARSAELASRIESAKAVLVQLAASEAQAKNVHWSRTRERDQAARRWGQLRIELAEADERLAAAQHAIASLSARVGGLRFALRAAQGEKEERAERVRSLSHQMRDRERRVAELQNLVVQSRSRLQYLEEVQRNYEGYHRGVRSILLDEQRSEGVLGVVADVLGVPAEHERAVAAALGDRLQYVIVRGEHDGADAVTKLRHRDQGRGSFIPLSPRPVPLPGGGAASLNGNTRRLLDVVHVDEQYRSVAEALLGEVVLVPNLGEGLALWRRNGVHVTMVTPEGDVIDASGVITGGSERPIEEEIVSRQRMVDELASDIRMCEERTAAESAEVRRLQAELAAEEINLSTLDREAHSLTLGVVAAEKDVERLSNEVPRLRDRSEVIAFETRTIADEDAEIVAELVQLDARLTDIGCRRAEQDGALSQLNDSKAACVAEVESLSSAQTSLRVRLAQRQQRVEAITAAAQRLHTQRQEMIARGAALELEQEAAVKEHQELCAHLEEARAQLLTQETRCRQAADMLPATQSRLQGLNESLRNNDGRMREIRVELDETRRMAMQVEVALAEKRLRLEHLGKVLIEKYGHVEDAAESNIFEELEESELSGRIEDVRGRLSRMGEVSVGAIDELKELEERADFLRKQKADLETSIADLERTIQKLNRASKTRFAETFAQVNERFQDIFPRLFRGGEARLVLTDETNMLETGVEIVVRPPGKRLDTVTLLSGGEKALVAVSLLFSLFLINPTPFCFLDEVDAPLDDANIGRFTQMVREMSAHSQFIVITHNKRTMQAADVLYGVTMQEPGISKVISVAAH